MLNMTGQIQVVELREIYSLLTMCSNMAAKACMTLILSSGMSRTRVENLTINDLLLSCNITSIDNLDECGVMLDMLLRRNPDNIIPRWEDETEDTYQVNFSSPESLFYTFLHLKERLCDDEYLEPSDKLFKISTTSLSENFNISKKLTEMGSYNHITHRLPASHAFGAKDLQNFFEKQCIDFLPDYGGKTYTYKHQKFSKRKVQTLKLFRKGIPKDEPYFKEFRSNPNALLWDYSRVLPHVIAKNYDSIVPGWMRKSDYGTSDEKDIDRSFEKDFDARVKLRMKDNVKRDYTDVDVTNIVSSHVSSRLNNINTDEFDMRQLLDFAYEDNSMGYFKDSERYLDCLMMKGYLKEDILSCMDKNIEIMPLTESRQVEDIISILSNAGIIEYYSINPLKLESNIKNYIDYLLSDGSEGVITPDAVLDICFETML